MNYRGFAPRAALEAEVARFERAVGAAVEWTFGFGVGMGADQRAVFQAHPVAGWLRAAAAAHNNTSFAAGGGGGAGARSGTPPPSKRAKTAASASAAAKKAALAAAAVPPEAACRVAVAFQGNPGRSDATQVWFGLPEALRGGAVLPFTCGPGHRSHRTRDGGGFLRKTHGVNEGFHIASGRRTLPFFLHMVLKIAGGGD